MTGKQLNALGAQLYGVELNQCAALDVDNALA